MDNSESAAQWEEPIPTFWSRAKQELRDALSVPVYLAALVFHVFAALTTKLAQKVGGHPDIEPHER